MVVMVMATVTATKIAKVTAGGGGDGRIPRHFPAVDSGALFLFATAFLLARCGFRGRQAFGNTFTPAPTTMASQTIRTSQSLPIPHRL